MTNFCKQKFQWFFDMNTSTDGMQEIVVNAGGNEVYTRLAPFFNAFKKFKLGSVSIRMVPASTLPVDPTGLSLEAGESTVDPRDQFNPGLIRITNGDAMADVTWDADDGNNKYYATLLDNRWFKFRLQNGVKRTAKPLVWNVGEFTQDPYPGMTTNVPIRFEDGTDNHWTDDVAALDSFSISEYTGDSGRLGTQSALGSSPYGLVQTGKIPLGWMNTDYVRQVAVGGIIADTQGGLSAIPEVELLRILLPMAFKTKYYYRVYVTETVMFKDAVAINPFNVGSAYYNAVDRFVAPGAPIATYGNTGYAFDPSSVQNKNDGSGAEMGL